MMAARWRFCDWWSLGLGLGLLPFMPGTMGTLLAIPLAAIVHSAGVFWGGLLTVVITVYSWWACCETYQAHGQQDYSSIVSDEVVGMLLVLWALPFTGFTVVLGFALFRFFDISKPWPVSMIDRRSGPTEWGAHSVMLDDIMAAVYARTVLQLCLAYW